MKKAERVGPYDSYNNDGKGAVLVIAEADLPTQLDAQGAYVEYIQKCRKEGAGSVAGFAMYFLAQMGLCREGE